MPHHIIIGGGPAATNCIEALRETDSTSPITLICDEPAHSRMALPYWLAGQIPREQTHTADADHFAKQGVQTRIGQRVTTIDPVGNTVTLDDGNSLSFDRLLIATGSSPLAPPITGTDLPGVQPLWTLAHTEHLLQATAHLDKPRVVLVGAGFIGFIMLNAMFKRGWQLTVVEREGQVLPRMLDGTAADMVQQWLKSQSVGVHVGTSVQAITQSPSGAKCLQLDNGQQLEADIVVIATGIQANLGLIAGSGIATDQGILVNDRMQTNFPHIYAAGDVAQGPVLGSSQSAVHAIQPTAVEHGRIAGANMAGQEVHYPGSLLMNIVDICGLQGASFGGWNDEQAETTIIANPGTSIYRKLLWRDDQLVGAIFTGRANDLGMLTDVGMVKGILQSQTRLGAWKQYLVDNPFDIRRAYIGAGIAQQLAGRTLLGRPTRDRKYRFGGIAAQTQVGTAHAQYVSTKK